MAFHNKIITGKQLLYAMKSVNALMEMIQSGYFPPEICNKYELNTDLNELSEEKKQITSVKTIKDILKKE